MVMTACSSPTETVVTRDVPVTAAVPQYLLNCAKTPGIPGTEARMPEINLFLIDLHAAHADCHEKLRLTADILENFRASIDARAAEVAADTVQKVTGVR